MERNSEQSTVPRSLTESTQEVPPFVSHLSDEDRAELFLDYARCYPHRGMPETWGATPTDMQASLIKQANLIHAFARHVSMFREAQDIAPSVSSYVERTFLTRFVDRCIANDENYRRALSPTPFSETERSISEEQQLIEERASVGEASIAEILALQAINAIGAIELGSLTHTYGVNINYLQEMRDTAEHVIRLFGGEVFENPADIFSMSEVINGASPSEGEPGYEEYRGLSEIEKIQRRDEFGGVTGLVMTRKRTIGQLPDATLIRQRTSFILTEKSDLLTDEVLDTFAATPVCDHWGREAIRAVGGIDEIIKLFLDTDSITTVVPVSTTLYAFNRERVEAIKVALDEANKHAGPLLNGNVIHDSLRQYTAARLYEAGMSGITQPPAVQYTDIDGMAFFGKQPD